MLPSNRLLRIAMIVLVMLAWFRVREGLSCWGWGGPGVAIAACHNSLALFRLYARLGHSGLDRNFAWAYRNLAEAHMERGDLDSALTALTRSIHHQPTTAAYTSRATIHLRRGERRAARDNLREVLRLDPANDGAWAELERVEAEIAAATKPPPQPLRLAELLTACQRGRFEVMLQACGAALAEPSIRPVQKAMALAGRGLVHAYRERLDDAARDLAEAIRLDPRRPAYHATYGDVLRKQGRTAEAAAAYRVALALDADFAPALAGLAALGQAAGSGASPS